MRTPFTFLTLCLILPLLSAAQITISQGDMPQAGDTIRTSNTMDIGLINFEETGNNFTWDFSQLMPFTQTVDTFVSVSETPWLYQLVFFMSSNLARKLMDFDQYPGFQVTDSYEYYKSNSSDYRLVGNATTLSGIPLPNKFQNPDIIYRFPLTAGNVDSSLMDYEISIPGIGYSGGWKKRVNHADGWGTLITPYGTFETVRVRSEVIQFDSLYLDTLGFGFPFYRQYTEYKWLGDGFGLPLCTVTDNGLIAEINYIDSVRSLIIGIPDLTSDQHPFQILPNPSEGKFRIRFKEDLKMPAEINIYSLNGICVFREKIQTCKEIFMNLEQLKPSTYLIRIKNDTDIGYEKIILK